MNASTQRNTTNASRSDSPKSNKAEQLHKDRVEVDVSEMVLCARCEIAMARVQGPFDVGSAYEHARAARVASPTAPVRLRCVAPICPSPSLTH
jgi:hypothetical protein